MLKWSSRGLRLGVRLMWRKLSNKKGKERPKAKIMNLCSKKVGKSKH